MAKMWFGTEGRMRWIDAPMSGADVSQVGMASSGTLLGGGGYVAASYGAHKEFVFSWSNASSRRAAAVMQAYNSGSYGRGLLYFLDPHTLDTNVLPAFWADPSMTLGNEAPPLIRSRRLSIRGVPTPNPEVNDLPAVSAVYELGSAAIGFPGAQDSLFIPVPPGSSLRVGAIYTATGSGGVFAAPVDAVGTAGAPIRLTEVAPDAENIIPDEILPGAVGVRLWVGRSAAGAASVTISAMTARVLAIAMETTQSRHRLGPWSPGEGHTGCRMSERSTLVRYNGVGGGQVGYAATFMEVGAWEF